MTPLQHLHRARPTDPFVQWRIEADGLGAVAVDGDHIAWVRHDREVWGTALVEDPARLVALLERIDADQPLAGVTVPAEAFASLPGRFVSPDPGYWSLWFIDPADVAAGPTARSFIAQVESPQRSQQKRMISPTLV